MSKKTNKDKDNKIIKSVNKNVRSSTRKLNPILKSIVGKKVFIIEDACRAIDLDGSLDNAIKEMKSSGVQLLSSPDLLS